MLCCVLLAPPGGPPGRPPPPPPPTENNTKQTNHINHTAPPPTHTIPPHPTPPNNDPTCCALGKRINSSNHQLHIPSQFKIFHNVRIHPNFLRQHKNITQATLSLDNCIAIFCDFSHGHGDLQLTTIFNADRTTNYLNPDTITSLIVDHLSHVLDLKPSNRGTHSIHPPPASVDSCYQ